MAYDYDLLVIGAGSAGLAAAKQAAHYQAKVAIVEQEHLGGVCVNRGCIPKKLLAYAADFATLFEDAAHYGWTIEKPTFSWQHFIQTRNQELDRLRQSQQQALQKAGVETIYGQATFVDPHTVVIDDRKVTANKILIAVGSKPIQLKIPGIEQAKTSREMLQLDYLPDRVAIIGGGYIGVEFASTLRGFGAKVFLIEHDDCILTGFDDDLRHAVRDGLVQRGVTIFGSTTVKSIESTSAALDLTLSSEDSSKQSIAKTLSADIVLCATGRTPNLEPLNLEQAGVELQDKAIAVDSHSRTSQPHIFAVGDCTNRLPLTPVVRAEGRAFADTVFGHQPHTIDYDSIPSAVFSRPEAAVLGMTKTQAREQLGDDNIDTRCIRTQSLYDQLREASQPMLFKLVFQKKPDRILGIHLVGRNVAEIIQGMGLAMKKGATRQDLEDMIGIHPTLAEEFFN